MTQSDGQGDDSKAATGGAPGKAESPAPEAPALAVIEAFGGIRPMAKTLGLAVSTVQGWKERSAIPANRHDQIRAAARQNNIDIEAEVLRNSAGDGAPSQPQTIEGQVIAGESVNRGQDRGGDKAATPGKTPDSKPDDNRSAEKKAASSGEAPKMSAASAAAARASGSAGAAPPPRGAAASRGGSFMPGLVAGVVLAVAVAAGTVYTRPYWAPLVDGGGPGNDAATAQLAALDARLADLQARMPADSSAQISSFSERLSTLEAALSQGAGQDPDTRAALESLNAQLARTTDRIAALEQEVTSVRGAAGQPSAEVTERLGNAAARLDEMLAAQSDLAQRLAEAESDLNAVEAQRDAAPGSRETLLLLAALQLRDALQGSGPYAQPLGMLKNLAAEDPALAGVVAPLERRASAGLPSLAALQAQFPDVARRIAANEFGQEGEGWTAGVLRRLSEAVNLRPVGNVEGDAPTAVAARAEVKLNDGDLAGAVAELNALDGAAAEAAASWLSDAEARLAATRAVDELGVLVSQRFATMSGN
jgi:hypothetical protein